MVVVNMRRSQLSRGHDHHVPPPRGPYATNDNESLVSP